MIKYLVSVGVFTTGFDAPHVDVVAILRLTESPGLLQQIIGRGLRLCEGKTDCLFLDYSENIDRHFPDGDVFAPEIRVGMSVGESQPIDCQCPLCDGENIFKARKNPDGYEIDKEGYFVDLRGLRIDTDHGPIPAHSGRRCQRLIRDRKTGDYNQCGYRWTFKECAQCQHENDIAARYCGECKAELVDPNEKLRLEFKQLKRDPTKLQTDFVTDWTVIKAISQRGREQWKINWQTPYRSFSTWTSSKPDSQFQWRDYEMLMAATNGMKDKPTTISYKKEDSGFFRFTSFNREADIDSTI
jgi:DNA repair protein RadD